MCSLVVIFTLLNMRSMLRKKSRRDLLTVSKRASLAKLAYRAGCERGVNEDRIAANDEPPRTGDLGFLGHRAPNSRSWNACGLRALEI